ncbi:MAG: HEAT repeat domain-containing protein [Thermoguttaceae bacterium]|jgi:hypothetical protein
MDGTARNFTFALVCCLTVWSGGGCGNRTTWPSWMLGSIQLDQVPGVTPPCERIKSLEELAQKAPSLAPEEKERVAAELVEEIRKEEDPNVRSAIIRALLALGGPTADRVLRQALNDPDSGVRLAACSVWGKRGGREAVGLLAGVLSSDIDKDIRMAAARALGHSHDLAAVPALGTALDDPDPAMQYVAVNSLHELTGRDFGHDVVRWREYVKSGPAQPEQSPALGDRLWHGLK